MGGVRDEIRAGTFRPGQEAAESATRPLTFEEFGETFIERYSKAREKRSWKQDELLHDRISAAVVGVGTRRGPLGDKPLSSVTGDDVEAFLQGLRQDGRAASTYNHYRQYLRALFAWATRKGYLTANPLQHAEIPRLTPAKRSRRLRSQAKSRRSWRRPLRSCNG